MEVWLSFVSNLLMYNSFYSLRNIVCTSVSLQLGPHPHYVLISGGQCRRLWRYYSILLTSITQMRIVILNLGENLNLFQPSILTQGLSIKRLCSSRIGWTLNFVQPLYNVGEMLLGRGRDRICTIVWVSS
jgi:hypothetical protein